MLVLKKSTLERMADIKYQEIASNINKRMNITDTELILDYIEEARSYGIHDEKEITVYVESVYKLKKSDYDMNKIRRLMQNQDSSHDHKLIPIRLLVDILERKSFHGPHFS